MAAVLAALARDRILQVAVTIYIAAFVVLALTARAEGTAQTLRGLIDPTLIGLTLLGMLWGRSRLDRRESLFWRQLALAWLCWLLVDLLYFFEIEPPWVSASFLTDTLYLLYYFLFALAIDYRPHEKPNRTLTALGRRLESVAGLMAVFGLLMYFALVVLPEPLGVSLSFVQRTGGLTTYLLMRLSLDALLLGRLLFAALSVHGRWRHVYGLLALGMLGYALRDLLSLLRYEELLPAAYGVADQAALYVPGFIVLVAARFPHGSSLRGVKISPRPAEPTIHELGRPSPIALYALVVPGLHFLLYPLGLLDTASRTPREVFSLTYVLIMGAMAWAHQRVLAMDNQSARAKLREAEESLSRSRKLEAVGRLAGGIAHDFNNYLTVIQGYGEILRERLQGTRGAQDLGYIEDAAKKASHLTRQLLAFGRRQTLNPEALEINQVVRETSRMLDTLLGEDVLLDIQLDPNAGQALADLGQTEQVLVNLAINGRDAMPDGGTLAIRTQRLTLGGDEAAGFEIEPGDYVAVVVADTGVGMTEDVRSQAFEPFFTTKALGRGTGLGLSTVYGIVKQSQGGISVESTPGQGTVIRVLLPSVTDPEPAPGTREPEHRAPKDATLLLVEDEGAVRRLARSALQSAGFKVFSAASGTEAVADYLDDCETIDLLVTDVLMPGMDGVELASRFQTRCPDLRVLFISGYPADTLRERKKILPRATRLLEKPFSPSTLVREVHDVLEDTSPVPLPEADSADED